MNVAWQLSPRGFSNTYIVSDATEAVVIDPGNFDRNTLLYIEERHLRVKAVLLTHRHASHTEGLRTMRRIWDLDAYARDPGDGGLVSEEVHDGTRIAVGGLEVLCLETPGHSVDSVCYRIGECLFTGDTLMAGEIGSTADGALRRALVDAIWVKLLVWPEDSPIFPGHGPPTRVSVERRFNPHLALGLGR